MRGEFITGCARFRERNVRRFFTHQGVMQRVFSRNPFFELRGAPGGRAVLRDNHYDVAFRAYLREQRVPYVAVDESRRALMRDQSLKSIDFIVSPPDVRSLLVDVKGRRFPSGKSGQGNRWENWATEDDITSLLRWQEIFGEGFRSALIFVYDLLEPRYAGEFPETFVYRDRRYACCGVWADEYCNEMRERSASWGTVTLPRSVFHELRQPLSKLLGTKLPGTKLPGKRPAPEGGASLNETDAVLPENRGSRSPVANT